MNQNETNFFELAIEEARKSNAEDERIHPKVGAILIKNGELVEKAYRGEINPGEHAEYTLLEKKLKDADVSGGTVYTTLEPCTNRNNPKVPCANRLIQRKVKRVVIGMLDPNPIIRGEGWFRLREAGVEVDLFPSDLTTQLEDLNREFIRFQRSEGSILPEFNDKYIQEVSNWNLDQWYRTINGIYWNRNFRVSSAEIFAHIVEIVGGLSTLASAKEKPGFEAQVFVAKAFAWWLVLSGKLGVKSVEDLIWDKFPRLCPYCQEEIHDPDICTEKKEANRGVPWELLEKLGKDRIRPKRLSEWQLMFSKMYPAQQTEAYGSTFARLTEELGELAESIRVFKAEPGYFLSEAADVFAWLMHIQNLIDSKNKIPFADRGIALERSLVKAYPGGCRDCGSRLCQCPPILSSTIGRIAHEVPMGRGSYGESGRFMTPEAASKMFRPSA